MEKALSQAKAWVELIPRCIHAMNVQESYSVEPRTLVNMFSDHEGPLVCKYFQRRQPVICDLRRFRLNRWSSTDCYFRSYPLKKFLRWNLNPIWTDLAAGRVQWESAEARLQCWPSCNLLPAMLALSWQALTLSALKTKMYYYALWYMAETFSKLLLINYFLARFTFLAHILRTCVTMVGSFSCEILAPIRS